MEYELVAVSSWSSYHHSYTWQKLKVACRDLGVERQGEEHRALPDALSALGVLKALAALHGHIELLPPHRERVLAGQIEVSDLDLGDLADHPF